MNAPFAGLRRFLPRFRRDEDGGPTVEFALVFFPFMLLAVSAFELGLLMTRHVMLERGMTMAMRQVGINTGTQLNEDQIKAMVCNSAGIIPNCTTQLKLEMIAIDMFEQNAVGPETIPRRADCVDHNDPFALPRNFRNGAENQVMMVRACARLVPMLPEMGLGWFLSRMDSGYYRVVSTTAFVMEPV